VLRDLLRFLLLLLLRNDLDASRSRRAATLFLFMLIELLAKEPHHFRHVRRDLGVVLVLEPRLRIFRYLVDGLCVCV